MDKVLKIDGMHCGSCASLLKMDIEEIGLGDKVVSIDIKGNNIGEMKLTDIDDSDIKKVIATINKSGKYTVIA